MPNIKKRGAVASACSKLMPYETATRMDVHNLGQLSTALLGGQRPLNGHPDVSDYHSWKKCVNSRDMQIARALKSS